MRVILNGEHAMNCNLAVAWIERQAFVNCLRHELCLSAHWLQFNSWRRRHADEKSWRSQFMMRQHQFIYKNEQSKNRRICFLLLLLFSACYMGLGLAHLRLTGQMRCSHLAAFIKFSAKDITLSSVLFFRLTKICFTFLQFFEKFRFSVTFSLFSLNFPKSENFFHF